MMDQARERHAPSLGRALACKASRRFLPSSAMTPVRKDVNAPSHT